MAGELWCASCRMDGNRVAAVVKIRGVPFCRPCRENYSDEPEALAQVVEWHNTHPVSEEPAPIARFGDTAMESVPTSPAVAYKCICGCGSSVAEAGGVVEGHAAKVIAPPEPLPAPAPARVSTFKVFDPRKRIAAAKPVDPPEEDGLAARLDEVLTEKKKEKAMRVKGVANDPLEEYLSVLDKAIKLYLAGNTTKEIAAACGLPSWRFSQSKKWVIAKREAGDPITDVADAAKPRKAKVKKVKTDGVTFVATGTTGNVGSSMALLPGVVGEATLAPRPNKLRFVLFEADVDSSNLSQLTDAISKAFNAAAAR